MTFKHTLTDEIGATKIIQDPVGWETSTIGLERTQWNSLAEVFKSSFLLYGASRDWILAREKTFGPDGDIDILTEIDPNDDGTFEFFYSGQIPIGLFIETLNDKTGHLLQINLTQNSFWTRFVNRYNSQVDLRSTIDLDGNAVTPTPKFILPLPSQVIRKKYVVEQKYNQCIDFSEGTFDGSVYSRDLQIDFDTESISEILSVFQYGLNPLNPSNTGKILPFAKFILTEDGDFTIDGFNITLSTQEDVSTNSSLSPMLGKENRTFSTIGLFQVIIEVNTTIKETILGVDRSVSATYNRNDGKLITLLNNTVTDYSFSGSLGVLKKGDQIRIYVNLITVTGFGINVDQGQPYYASIYRGLMVWGSLGWNKDNFCPYMGAENSAALSAPYIDARFTSLIDIGYDPLTTSGSGGLVANALTGFPVFRTDTTFGSGGSFVNINDAFVLASDGTVLGSGIYQNTYAKGTYLQVKYIQAAAGTISCNTGSAIVLGSGTNFNVTDHPPGAVINIVGGPNDPTRWIGQILTVDSTTQITLATNAGHTFVNENFSIIEFYIGSVSLYEGLEAFGDTHLEITFNSTITQTNTEAFLTHDIAAGILDRITGQTGLFRSNYYGNAFTSRIYGATGCGSNRANMKGLHLRGYPLEGDPNPTQNKPFAQSFQDWFEGANPIDCIGLGYDKEGDDDVIVCETIDKFFDGSSTSILLSNVYDIKRNYDPENQFSSAKGGYAKWQSVSANGVGTPSGIDDAQTVATRNSRFKKIGKQIVFLSKSIAASLTIETTRRIGNLLSANYTYDDETFVIALKSLGGGAFTPELDENFSSITNLSNSATRYNSRLSTARNFLRWLNYLSGCLSSYLSSTWNFGSGEGNFAMTSTMTTDCEGDDIGVEVIENGPITVSITPTFIPMPYEINHELSWNDYKTMRNNKNLCIGISQTDTGHKKYCIKSCERVIGTGLFKIIAWPKSKDDIIDIQVIESPVNNDGTGRRHESRFEPRFD